MLRDMLISFCFAFNHFLRSKSPKQASGRLDESSGLGRLHFSSCYFSQAFEDRHFTEREGFFRHEVRRATRSGYVQERGSHQKVRGRKRVRPERLKKPASKWKDVDIQPSQEFSQKRGRHSSYCGKIPRMRKGGLWVAERKLGP